MKTDNQQPITVAEAKSEATLAGPLGLASEDAALNELGLAAIAYADAYRKNPKCSSFFDWSDACNRLESAAIAWAKTQKPNGRVEPSELAGGDIK